MVSVTVSAGSKVLEHQDKRVNASSLHLDIPNLLFSFSSWCDFQNIENFELQILAGGEPSTKPALYMQALFLGYKPHISSILNSKPEDNKMLQLFDPAC